MSEEITPADRPFNVGDYVVENDRLAGSLPKVFRILDIYTNRHDDPRGQTMLVTEKGLGTRQEIADKLPSEVRHATPAEIYDDLFDGKVAPKAFDAPAQEGVQTRLHYEYADASNYKMAGTALFAGQISFDELVTLFRACEKGEDGFIPGQVGLPDLQERLADWNEETDHPWHELTKLELTSAGPKFDDVPDTRTISQFVAEIAQVEWDDAYRPGGPDSPTP